MVLQQTMGKKQFSPPASLEAQSTQRKAGVKSKQTRRCSLRTLRLCGKTELN
jgi:hypothetical protein